MGMGSVPEEVGVLEHGLEDRSPGHIGALAELQDAVVERAVRPLLVWRRRPGEDPQGEGPVPLLPGRRGDGLGEVPGGEQGAGAVLRGGEAGDRLGEGVLHEDHGGRGSARGQGLELAITL